MNRPDPLLTPGMAGPTRVARHVTTWTKLRIYRAYKVPLLKMVLYTVDHLIPLELNGTNSQLNLWPQPRHEAELKDRDENRLAAAYIAGTITLPAAQQEILQLWGP